MTREALLLSRQYGSASRRFCHMTRDSSDISTRDATQACLLCLDMAVRCYLADVFGRQRIGFISEFARERIALPEGYKQEEALSLLQRPDSWLVRLARIMDTMLLPADTQLAAETKETDMLIVSSGSQGDDSRWHSLTTEDLDRLVAPFEEMLQRHLDIDQEY